jgi:hypothetical protein
MMPSSVAVMSSENGSSNSPTAREKINGSGSEPALLQPAPMLTAKQKISEEGKSNDAFIGQHQAAKPMPGRTIHKPLLL